MKVSRTIRLDESINEVLNSNCSRHGDVTFHIENALTEYFKIGKKPQAEKAVAVAAKKQVSEIDPDAEFERFWLSGIRKTGKKQARAVFKKILSGKQQKIEFTDYLIKDVQWRLCAEQLGFAELHPTTYLRNERWTDERRAKTATSSDNGKPSLAARSAEQTAIIQAQLAAGAFDQRPMGQDDPAISQPVDIFGGGQAGGLWADEGAVDGEFQPMVSQNGGFD